ncbi:putative spore germination protein GerPC [Paenibacillus baekrokdamisoli]|uniref:Putative spore germination protein GerPC n=1 Tax=Paenibacillus baekrokdamisoli TaxID=1712516 RepID=A0A3G9IL19_9BACL|nr:spore germination protein GerPC [Paenibacillus baekrokdamisoli]MBB3067218.1 spore germination protein PC [Paenibacillus baekrokdamisoli]BBH19590.1 putative spore germination protein GerPC [Paenibacillus baekrokdamisoli]
MQPTNSNNLTPWQMCMSLSQSIYQLRSQLNNQQTVINQLSKQVDSLNERVKAAESRPVYHIDSMAYHFDQLKVEKLDGTLNIGMTPPSEETIKEVGQLVMPGPSPQTIQYPNAGGPCQQNSPFVSNGSHNGSNQQTSGPNFFPSSDAPFAPNATQPRPPYPEIRSEVDAYLNTSAPVKLSQLEAEFGVALDPFHRRLVIEDIRKQMSTRIQYYIQVAEQGEAGAAGKAAPAPLHTDPGHIKSDVLTKTTRDIDAALQSYLSKLQSNTN